MISLKTLNKTYEITYAITDDILRELRDDTSPGRIRPTEVTVKIREAGRTSIEFTGPRLMPNGTTARDLGRHFRTFADWTDAALAHTVAAQVVTAAAREFGLLDPEGN